jgi:hypothetical protein
MNRETFEKIFNGDYCHILMKDRIFQGLEIIRKYIPYADIERAEYDQVWSVNCDELIEAGIAEMHVKNLCDLEWFIDKGVLSHFVLI